MKEKEEKKYNDNGKEVVSPFIYYDSLKVKVDDDALSNTNRTVYLQSATSPKENNQFIFTPDEYDPVFQSNSAYTSFFGAALGPRSSYIDPLDVAKDYMANLTLNLCDRFTSSVTQNIRSIFYNGLFALIKPYININSDNKEYVYLFEDIFKMYYVDNASLFIKKTNDSTRIYNTQHKHVNLDKYIDPQNAADSSEMFVRTGKLHTQYLSDIAKRYDVFIMGITTITANSIFDIDKFAKDMAKDCDISSCKYEDNPYYSFACSILHEQANTDMQKISEYLEFELQHLINLYRDHCIDFSSIDKSKIIEDTDIKQISNKESDDSDFFNSKYKVKDIIHF